jgi:hypothetical protein
VIRIKIETRGLLTIGKNGFREIGREAIQESLLYWSQNYKKLHFENIAYRRYGYKSRNRKYSESKEKRRKFDDGLNALGEVKPLVFTGRTRERVLGQAKITTKAPNYQTYSASEVLDAPVLNFSKGKRIDMRAELLATNTQEEKTLNEKFTRKWNVLVRQRMLRSPKKTKVAT